MPRCKRWGPMRSLGRLRMTMLGVLKFLAGDRFRGVPANLLVGTAHAFENADLEIWAWPCRKKSPTHWGVQSDP
jgi:hypothetical protein